MGRDASRHGASRRRSFGVCGAIYGLAAAAAVGTGFALPAVIADVHPLLVVAVADVVATIVVFAASVTYDNASLYDPYWSVAPPVIGGTLALHAAPGVPAPRQILVLGLVSLWAIRLTWNWARGWGGLDHEDWRYVDLRRRTGRAWWTVSFLGVHLFPTVLVLLGCLSLWPALAVGTAPFGPLDALAASVALGGIAVEWAADRQLHRFRGASRVPGALLAEGVWSWSRNPNYFGEITFWCGLFAFAVAAMWGTDASWSRVILAAAGPAAMVALFQGVSIPMKERRMRSSRGAAWEAHVRRTARLVPRPPRAGA